MIDKYILDGKIPKTANSLEEWAIWLESTNRHVDLTMTKNGRVSTVFLGIDHSFGAGPPLLFETMIFGGPEDGYQERYSTWEEAELGHKKAVELARKSDF